MTNMTNKTDKKATKQTNKFTNCQLLKSLFLKLDLAVHKSCQVQVGNLTDQSDQCLLLLIGRHEEMESVWDEFVGQSSSFRNIIQVYAVSLVGAV